MQNVLVSPEFAQERAIEQSERAIERIEQSERLKRGAHAGRAGRPDWTIAMSIDVSADKRRIFHALTVPEYLEAWIDLPDRMASSRVVVSHTSSGYHLEHDFGGLRVVSIIGCFLSCHQRKMRLLWQKTCGQLSTQSLVDFRLRGNFGSSILELRHSAFASAEEFLYYQQLWPASLAKLANLLRPN